MGRNGGSGRVYFLVFYFIFTLHGYNYSNASIIALDYIKESDKNAQAPFKVISLNNAGSLSNLL